MDRKEMRKLRRDELLEMLIEQTKRGDALEEEVLQLRRTLQSREIAVREAGTLADAALQLNAIFEAADNAATQYLENIRLRSIQGLDPELGESEVARHCAAMLAEAERECAAMKEKAKAEADAYWAEVFRRLEQYLEDNDELTDWLLRHRESRLREGKA